MKKILLLIFIGTLFFSKDSKAQFSKYIIRFKDKAGTPYSINNPSQYLSPRSIQRRVRQHISIDSTDLPITPRYIDSVQLAGSVTILNKSKWLNEVCIQTTDAAALAKINNFPFVISSNPVMRTQQGNRENIPTRNKFNEEISQATTVTGVVQTAADVFNYGNSFAQIHIHEGEFLHNNGFKGEGMLMAMFDAGYRNYLTVTAFDSVRNNNQIVETYDYVKNEISVTEDDPHGMYCFSIIAGNSPGQLVGSCPKAKFYLYRTEDVSSEYPIEEQNWAAAAERADSIGVDVFSTSLGYTTFTNPIFNHTYADMNGKVTIIAKANTMAARKGIISVVAAGNDGNNPWHYISTPADADSIVSVGAVNASGVVATFSGFGPSSDGRIKPTVASVGQGTAYAGLNNLPNFGNGTSLACPNLAGLITCLWQAFPEFTNMQIIEAVKRSSSIYTTPDDRIGYGIPNFHKAYDNLFQQRILLQANTILANDWIKVYPNPFMGNFTLLIRPQYSGISTFKLYGADGKLYVTKQVTTQQGQAQFISFNNLQPLAKGIYTLRYSNVLEKRSIRIMAQ
ncbi:MAG: family serine peptidase [Chitinophagaceae bacterium]|nr:family serine peptidase [Chitinophagaceae bacterium]